MSVSDARTMVSRCCKALQEIQDGLDGGIISALDTARTSDAEELAPLYLGGISAVQAALGGVVSPQLARALLDPALAYYATQLSLPRGLTSEQILDRINESLISGSVAIKSRNITHGSPTAFSPSSKGALLRLTKDWEDMPIEVGPLEVLTFRCIRAFGEVQRYNEIFEVFGATQDAFNTARSGSGFRGQIQAVGPEQSRISNPRLNQGSDGLSGWTSSGAGTLTKTTASTYLPPADGTTETIQRLTGGSKTLAQTIRSTSGLFPRDVPVVFEVWIDISTISGAGSVVLSLGTANSGSLTLAGTGWQPYRLTIGPKCWYRLFADGLTTDIPLSVAITHSSGTIGIAHIAVYPMQQVRGHWYLLEAGSTPFELEDASTVTDALVGSDSINQYWLQWAYGKFLRSTTGSPGWADL